MKNRIVSVTFSVLVFFCILSCSIALPILFRPFYYALIKPVVIPVGSASPYWNPDWTFSDIKKGYDEILDYCIYPWDNTFSAGIFSFTEDASVHFRDCKILFYIDFIVAFISILGIGIIHILKRKGYVEFRRFLGRSPAFYGAAFSIILPLFVIIVVFSIGFYKVFEAFHKLFFPGKVWQFDEGENGFILIMPEEFFGGCAALIGGTLLISSCVVMILDIVKRKNKDIN